MKKNVGSNTDTNTNTFSRYNNRCRISVSYYGWFKKAHFCPGFRVTNDQLEVGRWSQMNHNYVHIVVECPPVYYCSVRCRACLNHLGQMPVGFWAVLGRWAGSVLRRSGAGGLRAGEVFVASKNMLYSREAPSLCSTMYRCCLL